MAKDGKFCQSGKHRQIWSHCSGAITDAKKVLCYWTRRAPRTFCRKDEKNGDDDGTDSAAPNQNVTSSSEFPRELEGCQLCLGHTSRRSQQVLQRPRLMQIIENFLFLLQWTATVAGRSRFAASLNEPWAGRPRKQKYSVILHKHRQRQRCTSNFLLPKKLTFIHQRNS